MFSSQLYHFSHFIWDYLFTDLFFYNCLELETQIVIICLWYLINLFAMYHLPFEILTVESKRTQSQLLTDCHYLFLLHSKKKSIRENNTILNNNIQVYTTKVICVLDGTQEYNNCSTFYDNLHN